MTSLFPNLTTLCPSTDTDAAARLARLEVRSSLGLDDTWTTTAELVDLIPSIVADAVSDAIAERDFQIEEWLTTKGASIVNEHADGFLQMGVYETASCLLRRVRHDLEDIKTLDMDPVEALECFAHLLDRVANAAGGTGKKSSQVLEDEEGAFFATAQASDWSDSYGEFLCGSFADEALEVRP